MLNKNNGFSLNFKKLFVKFLVKLFNNIQPLLFWKKKINFASFHQAVCFGSYIFTVMDNKSTDQKPSNFGIHRPKENLQKNTLSEFLPQLENYSPTIPDGVTCYYMNSSGLNCTDPRM